MERAFEPGDPVLDVAFADSKTKPSMDLDEENYWIQRPEQEAIDAIVGGVAQEHYFLLIGEKGTGKSSMLLSAMRKNNGEGVAMFEAHADLEIFRVRLGKALDFEYHEDNIGSLFSIRGPRDASALLDIERAFNKLEKVALRRLKKTGKPLVLIMNNMHLIRDDEDGKDLLELIQQRAEQWAAANLVTVVFNSDDYWVYERMKNYATRLKVLSVKDLPKDAAIAALKSYRQRYFSEQTEPSMLEEVYERVGGRLSHLSRVAKDRDMLEVCKQIEDAERTWLLNKCWILGSEMDDDVMDQQKFASAAMVLAKALVDQEQNGKGHHTVHKNRKHSKFAPRFDDRGNHVLPYLPIHLSRQVMTRADFLKLYDHENIFTITAEGMVRADSVPMMQAFRVVCSQPGFDQFLEDTLERIGDIESLGRTRELTIKDLWDGGKYRLQVLDRKDTLEKTIEMQTVKKPEDDDD
jgi:vacuolar-type H+-ATPase subunit E/Vma4